MDRRSLLQALGATAALAAIPRSAEAADALVRQLHERLAQPRAFRTLTAAQQALVTRVADLVIPRTDTPGALDVEVPALIDLLLTEWYDPAERQVFLANIDAMNRIETERGIVTFTSLPEPEQVGILRALDGRREDKTGAAAAFRELKALTVFGYFTSERVTKDILQVRMVFPRYQGDAPVGA